MYRSSEEEYQSIRVSSLPSQLFWCSCHLLTGEVTAWIRPCRSRFVTQPEKETNTIHHPAEGQDSKCHWPQLDLNQQLPSEQQGSPAKLGETPYKNTTITMFPNHPGSKDDDVIKPLFCLTIKSRFYSANRQLSKQTSSC